MITNSQDQQLIAAGMHYLTLLNGDHPPSIPVFVAACDPALRDELPSYLELMLATSPGTAVTLTPDEQVLTEHAAARVRVRMSTPASPSPARSLTAARLARRLSLGALAREINLPPDLLARIERGGVLAATIPARPIARLATALQEAEGDVRALLAAPVLATSTRLSAADGTVLRPEVAINFDEALRLSAATPAQRKEWA